MVMISMAKGYSFSVNIFQFTFKFSERNKLHCSIAMNKRTSVRIPYVVYYMFYVLNYINIQASKGSANITNSKIMYCDDKRQMKLYFFSFFLLIRTNTSEKSLCLFLYVSFENERGIASHFVSNVVLQLFNTYIVCVEMHVHNKLFDKISCSNDGVNFHLNI